MRHLVLGNRSLTVLINKSGKIRDFYFPHVGQENHLEDYKLGVFVENKISWLDEQDWQISSDYVSNSPLTRIKAINSSLKIELSISDAIHPEHNVFIRKITITNKYSRPREVKLYSYQYFKIYGTDIANSAYFHPKRKAIIVYKGKRYFLISGINNGKGFEDYAAGRANFRDLKGTYVDAEDGMLSKNPVEHGPADSAIGFYFNMQPNSSQDLYYYIAAGKKFRDICNLDSLVVKKTPQVLINETQAFYKKWLKKCKINLSSLGKRIKELFYRSLLTIITQVDINGGILASTDSEVLRFNKDSYNYVWPRDAAFISIALTDAGYPELSKEFFLFAERTIAQEGYFMTKYNPDCSAGSSWHPWLKYGVYRLPIQEDETALVLYALYKYYKSTKDNELINKLFPSLIKPAADFLCAHRDKKTKLPEESYDIWEEKFGIHTYTSCTVYAALIAASELSLTLDKKTLSAKYKDNAELIKQAILANLYNKKENKFLKRIHKKYGKVLEYKDSDASTFYALNEFNIFDKKITDKMTKEIIKEISCPGIGGLARYQNDQYFSQPNKQEYTPGNPWFITTLWLAQYYIKEAKNIEDLSKASDILNWVVSHSIKTGLLPEQLDPFTGEPLSVCPLTWSHAEFVETVCRFIKKKEELKKSSISSKDSKQKSRSMFQQH